MEATSELFRELDGGVVGFDQPLYLGHMQVRQVTGAELPAPADVVEVLLAVPASTGDDDEPTLAALAPDQAFEVVVVGPLPGTCPPFVEEDPLDPVKEFLRDERLMPPLVLDTLVTDVSNCQYLWIKIL